MSTILRAKDNWLEYGCYIWKGVFEMKFPKMFKPLNNKGISFIDISISFIVLMILIKVITVFEVSTTETKIKTKTNLIIIQSINKIVEESYNIKKWDSLNNETLKTAVGDIDVVYKLKKDETVYSTDKLVINISHKDYKKVIELERSIYD